MDDLELKGDVYAELSVSLEPSGGVCLLLDSPSDGGLITLPPREAARLRDWLVRATKEEA